MFHCPMGVWVIEQHAIILIATVRSPTVRMWCFIIASDTIVGEEYDKEAQWVDTRASMIRKWCTCIIATDALLYQYISEECNDKVQQFHAGDCNKLEVVILLVWVTLVLGRNVMIWYTQSTPGLDQTGSGDWHDAPLYQSIMLLLIGIKSVHISQVRFPRHRGLAIPTCIAARAWRTCRDACRYR